MLTTIAAFVSAIGNKVIHTVFPTHIQRNWVADLTSVITEDIRFSKFGPRRHVLDKYVITYRLDISPGVLRRVLANHVNGVKGNSEFPTLSEVLNMAKVWLSYDEEKLAQVCRPQLPNKPILKLTVSLQAEDVAKHASLSNTFRVTFDQSLDGEQRLPVDVKAQWRADLTRVILADLKAGNFGARRHTLPAGYDITYRLDINHARLEALANAPRWTSEEGVSLSEILNIASVWITTKPSAAHPSSPDLGSPSLVSSPVPSECTLVDEDGMALDIVKKVEASAPFVPEAAAKIDSTVLKLPSKGNERVKEYSAAVCLPLLAKHKENVGATGDVPRPIMVPTAREASILELLESNPRYTCEMRNELHIQIAKGLPNAYWLSHLHWSYGLDVGAPAGPARPQSVSSAKKAPKSILERRMEQKVAQKSYILGPEQMGRPATVQ